MCTVQVLYSSAVQWLHLQFLTDLLHISLLNRANLYLLQNRENLAFHRITISFEMNRDSSPFHHLLMNIRRRGMSSQLFSATNQMNIEQGTRKTTTKKVNSAQIFHRDSRISHIPSFKRKRIAASFDVPSSFHRGIISKEVSALSLLFSSSDGSVYRARRRERSIVTHFYVTEQWIWIESNNMWDWLRWSPPYLMNEFPLKIAFVIDVAWRSKTYWFL